MNLTTLLEDLFYLFFPRTCQGCGALLIEVEKSVCLDCLFSIERTAFHLSPTENELFLRLVALGNIEAAAALFYFDSGGKLRKMITALKYHDCPHIGRNLGAHYGKELVRDGYLDGISCLVPVPLHPKRERERGYNQANEIAKGISEVSGIPVAEKYLKRIKASKSQTKKGKDARWESMKDLFEIHNPIEGGVLLIDDVITTGSTLLACVRAIEKKEDPSPRIKIACLAVTRKRD